MTKKQAEHEVLLAANIKLDESGDAATLRYDTVLQALNVGIAHWKPDTSLVYANAKCYEICGIDESALGQKWRDLLPETKRTSSDAFFSDLARNPRSVAHEQTAVMPDGSMHYYRWVNTPIFNADGELVEFQSVVMDITENKQTELLVAAQRDLARLVGASLSDDEIWAACLQIVLNISGLDCGGIYQFDALRDVLELKYYCGLSEEFAQAARIYDKDSPSAQIVLAGQARSFSEDQLFQKYHRDEGIRAVIMNPIQYRGEVIGCLNIGSHHESYIRGFAAHAIDVLAPEIGSLMIYLRSNTLRRQAEEALQKSTQILQESQAIAHMGSWTIDLKASIYDLSVEAAQILGVIPGQHASDALTAYIHPDDIPSVLNAWNQALQTGIYDSEHRFFRNSEVRWLRATAKFKYDDDGIPFSALGICQDITARKLVEEERRETDDRYRLLYESMVQGVVFQDANGQILHANPSAEKILGLSLSQLQGLASRDENWKSIHEDGSPFPGDEHPAMQALRTGKPVYNVLMGVYHPPSREYRWINISAVPRFLNGNSTPYQVFTTFEDVTERKEADELLRQSEQRLRQAQIIGRIGDWEIDMSKGQLFYSAQMYELLERDPALGPPSLDEALDYLEPDAATALQMLIAQAIQDGTGWEKLMCVRLPSGREAWHLGIGAVIRNKYGDVVKISAIAQDVTQRVSAERELRESNERFAQIAANISEIFWVDDVVSAQNIYVSSAFDSIFGRSYEEIRKLPGGFASVIHPEDRQIFEAAMAHQREGQVTDVKYRIAHPDGSYRWLRDKGSPVFDDAGKVVRVVGIARDITSQIESEQRLAESEARFRQIAQTVEEAFWMFDNIQQRVIYVNQAFEKIWGIEAGQLYANTHLYIEAILPEDREILFAALERQACGESTTMEYRVQPPNGPVRWIYDRSFPIFDETGQLVRTTGIATDITARKQAELDLRASEAQYRELSAELEERVRVRTAEMQDLYDNAPIGYHSLDANSRLVLINKTHADWLGLPREQILGRPLTDFLSPESRDVFNRRFSGFMQKGSIRNLEVDLVAQNGRIIPVLISASAIYNENGDYTMSRSTVFDNTEQKKADEAMRQANREMARAMRMKDEFLASMSHELRTPLTGILGLSESLQLEVYGPLSEKQHKILASVENSGRHLLNLINDILDVSKIEAGKLDMDMQECDLEEICRDSVQMIKGMAAQKNHTVHFSMPPGRVTLYADVRRIKQVLVNLLGNAVKFTHENGELGLDVAVNSDDKTLTLSVWDYGIGISPENLKKLFQPFVQLDSSLSRQHNGTGLGLVLAQRIVEAHGGGIHVESQPGNGSRFHVVLPYSKAETIELQPVLVPDCARDIQLQTSGSVMPSVMVVDDNEINVETMSDFLEAQNYRVTRSSSGLDFLARVCDVRPDMVLMDVQMPGLDGLETIRRLRLFDDPAIANLPVIAVTALAMPGDRDICLAAGANEYISKPFRLPELLQLMTSTLQKEG